MNTDFIINGCIEYEDLFSLIHLVKKLKEPKDNMIVILDSLLTNDNMISMVHSFDIEPVFYPFDNWNNRWEFEKTLWQNDLIFHLDADELPSYMLLKIFRQPFIDDPDLEMLAVPRINIYTDSTPENVAKMYVGNRPQDFILQQEKAHPLKWINWPDYQFRIHRAVKHIVWGSQIHAGPTGYKKMAVLPADVTFALLHAKTIEHQGRILKFYDELEPQYSGRV